MLSDIAKAGEAAGPLKPASQIRRRGDRRRNRQRAAAGLLSVAAVGLALAVGPAIGVNRGPDKTPTAPLTPTAGPTTPTASPTAATPDPTITASAANPATADSPSTSTTGPGSGIEACRADALSVRIYGGNGFPGGGDIGVALTNTSSHSCKLSGYVGLRWVDGNGRALPTTVVHEGDRGRRFTVAPGEKGYFQMTVHNVPLDGEGAPCEPPAAALLVTPPHDTDHLTIDGTWRACQHGRVELTALVDHPDPNLAPTGR